MRLIDISHTLDSRTPLYPGDYKTMLSEYATLENDSYNSYVIKSGLHTGTHIDAPLHLIDDERTVADFAPECFTGKGILIDARLENPVKMKQDYADTVAEGSIVLINTGFDKYYYDECYFTDFPELDIKLAEFLIARKIKIVGLDTPSPDKSPFNIHKLFLANGVFVLENLTNLESLKQAKNFDVVALPLKIRAEASFVRAVCFLKD